MVNVEIGMAGFGQSSKHPDTANDCCPHRSPNGYSNHDGTGWRQIIIRLRRRGCLRLCGIDDEWRAAQQGDQVDIPVVPSPRSAAIRKRQIDRLAVIFHSIGHGVASHSGAHDAATLVTPPLRNEVFVPAVRPLPSRPSSAPSASACGAFLSHRSRPAVQPRAVRS